MPAVDRPGTPGGPYLVARLRERARRDGLDLHVDLASSFVRSSFTVTVAWGPQQTEHLVCEVHHHEDAVHLHDAGGAEVRLDEAVDYVALRVRGTSSADALARVRPPKQRWWSRLSGG